jgi:SAM-dependent methyltransferase
MSQRAWIQSNQDAWNALAENQYKRFKQRFEENDIQLNPLLIPHIKDIKGKRVLHLQCNTGADSIMLARLGAHVTGVDFAPDNIKYAKMLSIDTNTPVTFIQGDVTRLWEVIDTTYDLIITFDGVLGWLMDLEDWAKGLKHALSSDGKVIVLDTHPFYYVFDEEALPKGEAIIKYPYFQFDIEVNEEIGGYAGAPVMAKNGFKPIQMSQLINACAKHQLMITHMEEYDRCDEGMGGDTKDAQGLMVHKHFVGAIPVMLYCEIRHFTTLSRP